LLIVIRDGNLDETFGLVLFESTTQALKTEKVLKAAGVACAVIPTPLEFSSGCGIALLISEEEMRQATQALEGCTGHRLKYPYVRRPSK
jgi:Protein of unknown function (DUF3343)